MCLELKSTYAGSAGMRREDSLRKRQGQRMEEEPEELTYKAQPKEGRRNQESVVLKKKEIERERRTLQEEDIIGIKWCYKVK